MNKIKKIASIALLTLVCSLNVVAFAAPVKEDSDTKTTITVTDKEETSTNSSSKATAKATAKSTAKATATAKSTAKATATAKSTEKATAKATTKTTTKSTDEEDEKTTSSSVNLDKTTTKKNLDSKDDAEETEDVIVVETTPDTLNVQNNGEQLENDSYLTKGGAFLWFLFTVLVSAVISFAISYRFYKMSRRDNHVISELRALKRDIDSKMVGTIGGFSENDVTATNSNRSYARREGAVKTRTADSDIENAEIYKKWETQIHKNQGSNSEATTVNRGANERPGSLAGRNTERRRPAQKKSQGVGQKIKGVISDIFPFEK